MDGTFQGQSFVFIIAGAAKAVKQKFVAAADHVIDSYRNSDAVYETSWKTARDQLVRALSPWSPTIPSAANCG